MERDLDLIRTILIELAKNPDPMQDLILDIEGYSDTQVSYHVKLLHQAGLIEAMDFSSQQGLHWRPISLTWEGHEFLDGARNEKVWSRVKEELAEKGGSVPFEVIKAWLIRIGITVLGGGL